MYVIGMGKDEPIASHHERRWTLVILYYLTTLFVYRARTH